MRAWLCFPNGKGVDLTRPIPVTTHGIPILPGIGETVDSQNLYWAVDDIIWNYDAETVEVKLVKLGGD